MSDDLSDREKACLSWTAAGKSSWEISRILSISENTVVFHIKNAMRKLGVTNRTLAAVKAIELGLIEPAAKDPQPQRRVSSTKEERDHTISRIATPRSGR
jgi:DNA-binding CsgD family transcriptional regulator